MLKTSLLFVLFSYLLFAQEISQITLIEDEISQSIPSYNHQGTIYISVKHFSDALKLDSNFSDSGSAFEIAFQEVTLRFTLKNPYVVITSKVSEESTIHQLPTSSHIIDNFIFVPLNETIELFNKYFDKSLAVISPGKVIVLAKDQQEITRIQSVTLDHSDKGTFIHIKTNFELTSQLIPDGQDSFILKIKNASTFGNNFDDLVISGLVKHVDVSNINGDVQIRIKKKSESIAVEYFYPGDKKELVVHLFEREDSPWLERESEHFKVIYREYHSHLTNNILVSAEKALRPLSELFNYVPSDKIIINTYDVSDYGFAATSTTPQNFIRLEIEPMEPGYEMVPYNERIQWLINHELVHVIVNDAEVGFESFCRSIFGKVPPEKTQPLSVFYGLLTNYNRYSPRWHQEAIAVYFETWLSGGYGRVLGSFDEMYFRNLVYEGKQFPSQLDMETILSHNSILLENIHYIYGGRFVAYLSIIYGTEKVLDWFRTKEGDAYRGFEGKFRKVFNEDFYKVWDDFISYETKFQEENIKILEQAEKTPFRKINSENFGWVSRPYFDSPTNSVIFVYHRPHELTALQSLDLKSGISKKLISIATPSMLQVSSTALDEVNGLLFYTTNNNQFFRDIWVYHLESGDEKLLFENARVGDLAVSPVTHDLWGIQHDAGFATLVFSPYPYKEINRLITFDMGEEVFNLSINDAGKKLAATLKKSSGQQSIITFDVKNVLTDSSIQYKVISSSGSPENSSWSRDGNMLYWNAYTNGVSNIYRYDLDDKSIKAISHCITGLFRPIEISPDSVFAFEFVSEGFRPVIFENKSASFLPAINYFGQRVIDINPELQNWNLSMDSTKINPVDFSIESGFNGLKNLHIHSIMPVVSGFQNQVVFGLFTRISDPLLVHDFYMEAGISPLNETPNNPLWHLRFKYDYKQLFYIDVLYNGGDFFDLFNDRKRGTIGTQFKLGHTFFWKYDNPLRMKQETNLTFYRDVKFINDNLIPVSQPDFAVLATNLNFRNLRKTIGSSDYEFGNELNWTIGLYGTEFDQPEVAFNSYIELSDFSTWLWNHNVLHVKIAGGYNYENENLVQSLFYIGGFGNRAVDNDEIKQFRRIFRFPGIPIYSLVANKFGKMMLENAFPPIRTSGWLLLDQFVNHFDFAIYSQGLVTQSEIGNYLIDVGAQMDVKFKHWYNLESTFSAGIAKAWSWSGYNDWEWFLSIKLLKD
ncbi:MAG TPA: hypothetical protein VLH59_07870 [Ignavibacteriaceae bacterium]|nr:hypothetical protein [Ignavibacteriaceae bacterium]